MTPRHVRVQLAIVAAGLGLVAAVGLFGTRDMVWNLTAGAIMLAIGLTCYIQGFRYRRSDLVILGMMSIVARQLYIALALVLGL